MGAPIPKDIGDNTTCLKLLNAGFNKVYQGKTRDMFDLGDSLLVVASDRISIFDFVLNALVPYKGEVLTALTHFWLTDVLKEFSNHLLSSATDFNLNAVHDMKDVLLPSDMARCLVVKKVDILPYEMIFRHHIGGSVYKKYLKTGKAGGHDITPGLPQWTKLDDPIFTPSTKEEVGHDINVDADTFYAEYGNVGREAVANLYGAAYKKAYAYAEERDILILDTKLEGNLDMIADEVLTPDSSRFCDKNNFEEVMATGGTPAFYDKQPVRDWGSGVETPFTDGDGRNIVGINKLDAENPEHIAWVHQLHVPDNVVQDTTDRYLNIFERLTGSGPYTYQSQQMGIKPDPM